MSKKSYILLQIPGDILNCEYCSHCPTHGALMHAKDTEVPHSCSWGVDPEYCMKTLPSGLSVRISKIPGGGLGVFATRDFPAGTRFGPYEGKERNDGQVTKNSAYCWQIYKDGKPSHYVDARDPRTSNWMRFVNRARSEDEQCVTAYQHQGKIYYRAHRHISAGTEILVGYGDSYAKNLGTNKTQIDGGLSLKFIEPGRKTQLKPQGAFDGDASLQGNKLADRLSGIDTVKSKRSVDQADIPNASMEAGQSKDSGVKSIISCSLCDMAFSDALYMNRHFKKRHNQQYWEQQRKAEVSNSSSEFIDGKNVTPLQQPDNPKVTQSHDVLPKKVSADYLEKIKRIHAEDKPYECDVCGAGFNENFDLKRHKKTHTGEKPYEWDVYGARLTETGRIKIHKRTHTGENPFKCDVCGAGFSRTGDLNKHKRTHTGEKPFKCDVCDAGFTETGNLIRHRRIHTGEKPFKCDVCSVRFAAHFNLKSHKRTHTGERPYKCDVCDAKFTMAAGLKIHKRTHTGERPYRCAVCGAGFTMIASLIRHKKTHVREKPFKCDICNAGFTQTGHLKIHKRTHTGEKPLKCDDCGAGFTDC